MGDVTERRTFMKAAKQVQELQSRIDEEQSLRIEEVELKCVSLMGRIEELEKGEDIDALKMKLDELERKFKVAFPEPKPKDSK